MLDPNCYIPITFVCIKFCNFFFYIPKRIFSNDSLFGQVDLCLYIFLVRFINAHKFKITQAGTFLVTVDDAVIESDAAGNVLWRANVPRVNQTASHVWQALRMLTGETIVSTGYAASLEIYDAKQVLSRTITGPPDVVPNQYVGFQILPGRYGRNGKTQ